MARARGPRAPRGGAGAAQPYADITVNVRRLDGTVDTATVSVPENTKVSDLIANLQANRADLYEKPFNFTGLLAANRLALVSGDADVALTRRVDSLHNGELEVISIPKADDVRAVAGLPMPMGTNKERLAARAYFDAKRAHAAAVGRLDADNRDLRWQNSILTIGTGISLALASGAIIGTFSHDTTQDTQLHAHDAAIHGSTGLEAHVASLDGKVSDLQNQSAALSAYVNATGANYTPLKNQVDSLMHNLTETADNSTVAHRLAQLEYTLTVVDGQNNSLAYQIKMLKDGKADLSSVSSISDSLSALQERYNATSSQVESALSNYQSAWDALKTAQQKGVQIENLNEKLATLTQVGNNLTATMGHLDTLQSSFSDLESVFAPVDVSGTEMLKSVYNETALILGNGNLEAGYTAHAQAGLSKARFDAWTNGALNDGELSSLKVTRDGWTANMVAGSEQVSNTPSNALQYQQAWRIALARVTGAE